MTRAHRVLLGVTAIGVALLLLVALVDRQPDESADAETATTATSGLLDIELTTFEGARVRLKTFAGGAPLVVNFFASWCGPCVREMPDFEAVHGRRGNDVRFLGVSLQESPDAAAELVELTGVSYDIARDERGELFRAVNGVSMPTTVFLNSDGNLSEIHGGALSQRALEARIDRLLRR